MKISEATSGIEALGDNKVKLTVEVDETELETAIDQAFRRIAADVRVPGFRKGRAPRRVLEAQLGYQYGRQEAIREALPGYYQRAVFDQELDVIDVPELEVLDGLEEGILVFDATVQVRPVVVISGYHDLRIEVPDPTATDEEVDDQIEKMRIEHIEYETVERPAQDGDLVTINIVGSHEGEALPALSANDYDYGVGSGTVVAEIDENLRGTSAGDEIEFAAVHPDAESSPLHFAVAVLAVKKPVLPELNDAWVAAVSEFDTLEEWRADLDEILSEKKRSAVGRVADQKLSDSLAALVEEDLPEALINSEIDLKLHTFLGNIRNAGIAEEEFLSSVGKDINQVRSEFTAPATRDVKLDLALRAIAQAEELNTHAAFEASIKKEAQAADLESGEYIRLLKKIGELVSARAAFAKTQALDWLLVNVDLVDENGQPLEWYEIDSVFTDHIDHIDHTDHTDHAEPLPMPTDGAEQ